MILKVGMEHCYGDYKVSINDDTDLFLATSFGQNCLYQAQMSSELLQDH